MKKLIIKTALITFGVTIILAISLFGIVSFCAPAAMMRLTASLGLEGISADYAYQEYQQSGDIACLARSFEVAARQQSDGAASERFEKLISHEEFESYCAEQDAALQDFSPAYSYKNYIYGNGACVKYRLARTDEQKKAAYTDIALAHTDSAFTSGNPVSLLILAALEKEDTAYCAYLCARLPEAGFAQTESYTRLLGLLKSAAGITEE